jgi:nitronate monooxygenase
MSSKSSWNQNRLTKLLGIEYPIIQGPLGGLQAQKLAATVSNFGGLGSFGGLSLEPSAISDVIAEIRSLTAKPFALNLWVSMEDEGAFASDEKAFQRALAPLVHHIAGLGGTVPKFKPYSPVKFADQARALIDAKVPVFSFVFGVPPKEILDECRKQGIHTIGVATSVDEARALDEAGVDAIGASGFEAAGHKGAFLDTSPQALMGTFSLVPQIADAVSAPVVAAGGIADARGIVAAMALGAEGVQLGTAFLTCEGSGATATHREALLSGKAARTGLTKGFTGRLARGIRNQLMEDLNQAGSEILPYPLQRYLVRNVSTPAESAHRADLLPMWAGQSANISHYTDATKLMEDLVTDVSAVGDSIVDWTEKRRGGRRAASSGRD